MCDWTYTLLTIVIHLAKDPWKSFSIVSVVQLGLVSVMASHAGGVVGVVASMLVE